MVYEKGKTLPPSALAFVGSNRIEVKSKPGQNVGVIVAVNGAKSVASVLPYILVEPST